MLTQLPTPSKKGNEM